MTEAEHYQGLQSQETPHITPSRASYGVSIVNILEETDRVITVPHYTSGMTSSVPSDQSTFLVLFFIFCWRSLTCFMDQSTSLVFCFHWFKGLMTVGRELRQQYPSDLLPGTGRSREGSSIHGMNFTKKGHIITWLCWFLARNCSGFPWQRDV